MNLGANEMASGRLVVQQAKAEAMGPVGPGLLPGTEAVRAVTQIELQVRHGGNILPTIAMPIHIPKD
jgi:hypothetical protein